MKKLLKFFQPKVTYLPHERGSFNMSYVNDECDYIHDSLGMSKERTNEIVAIKEIADNHEACLDIVVKLSAQCVHPNELGFIAFTVGKYCESVHGNPATKLFKRLFS